MGNSQSTTVSHQLPIDETCLTERFTNASRAMSAPNLSSISARDGQIGNGFNYSNSSPNSSPTPLNRSVELTQSKPGRRITARRVSAQPRHSPVVEESEALGESALAAGPSTFEGRRRSELGSSGIMLAYSQRQGSSQSLSKREVRLGAEDRSDSVGDASGPPQHSARLHSTESKVVSAAASQTSLSEGWQSEREDLRHPRSVQMAQEAIFGFADGSQLNRFSFQKHSPGAKHVLSQREHRPRPRAGIQIYDNLDSARLEAQDFGPSRRPRAQSLSGRLYGGSSASTEVSNAEDPLCAHSDPSKVALSKMARLRTRLKSFSHAQDEGGIRDVRLWDRSEKASAPRALSFGLDRFQNRHQPNEVRESLASGIDTDHPSDGTVAPVEVLGMSAKASINGMRRVSDILGTGSSSQTSFSSLMPPIPPAPLPPPRQPRRSAVKVPVISRKDTREPQEFVSGVDFADHRITSNNSRSQQKPAFNVRDQPLGLGMTPSPLSPMSEEEVASLRSPVSEGSAERCFPIASPNINGSLGGAADLLSQHNALMDASRPSLPGRSFRSASEGSYHLHRPTPVPLQNNRLSLEGAYSFDPADPRRRDPSPEAPFADRGATSPSSDLQLSPLMLTGMVTAASSPTQWTHRSDDRATMVGDHDRIDLSRNSAGSLRTGGRVARPLPSIPGRLSDQSRSQSWPATATEDKEIPMRLGHSKPSSKVWPRDDAFELPDNGEKAPYADTGVQASLAALSALESSGETPRTILARQRILGETDPSMGERITSSQLHAEDDQDLETSQLREANNPRELRHAAYDEELRLLRLKVLQLESSLDHGCNLSGETCFDPGASLPTSVSQPCDMNEHTRRSSKSSTSSRRRSRPRKSGFSKPDIIAWHVGLDSCTKDNSVGL